MKDLITPCDNQDLPVVVIAGRPNTGKSTLFNRLIGKKRAITDPTSGVTRDAITEIWPLYNSYIKLCDSGGITESKEGFDDIVSRKSISLFEEADIILFVVECMGLSSEDKYLIEKLRPYTDKVFLVVNKVDDYKREDLIWNFYELGYNPVIGLSSAHGYNVDDLKQNIANFLDLDKNVEIDEEDNFIKLAVMGKPNTGKSTLVNALTSKETSIVSDIAGTTRDVITSSFYYKNQEFKILDTAGIRRKKKVDDDIEYYSVNRAIKSIDEADVILLMIDSLDGLTEQDKKIASLIVRRGKGVILVLNKIDLIKQIDNNLVAIEDRIRFLFPILNFAPVVAISALKKLDIPALLDKVFQVKKQLEKRVDTNIINTSIRKWSSEYSIPRGKNTYYKILYATQVSSEPVRFLLFVNRSSGFPTTYLQYLINKIRSELGFSLIPISINIKERVRNEARHKDRSLSLLEKKNEEKPEPKKRKERVRTSGKAIAKRSPHKADRKRGR